MSDRFAPESPGSASSFTPEKERLFELLMSELDHANQQIRSYSDFQTKLIAVVFTVLVAIVGWALGTNAQLGDHGVPYVLLAAFLVLCFTILHGVFSYGTTLNYMLYKHDQLNRQFADILSTPDPLVGLAYINRAAGHEAVGLAALVVNIVLLAGATALWCTATAMLSRDTGNVILLVAGAILLIFTAYSHFLLKRAIDQLLAFPTGFKRLPNERSETR